jgi:DNA-binding SARP family transcriptional activator
MHIGVIRTTDEKATNAVSPANNLSKPPISAFGSLSVNLAGREVDLGPPRRRAVLAMLLAKVGRVVSVSALLEGIWGTEPPRQAVASLQSYISRLRKVLSDSPLPDGSRLVLEYRSPGYVLVASPDQIDVVLFELRVDEGLAVARGGDHAAAFGLLGDALAMWSSAPFAELRDYEFAQHESSRLEGIRLRAVEQWAEAAFTLNRDAEVLPELEIEVARNPIRERQVGLLMRAQYRTGRQADALHTFDRTRRVLAEELGADPSPELHRVHAGILRHDKALLGSGQVVQHLDFDPPIPRPRDHRERPGVVGRERELACLLDAWTAAKAGGGRVALVVGEAGQGKTRLVRELETRCRSDGAEVLTVRCPQVPDIQAHWPWAQLLSQLHALCPAQVTELPLAVRRLLGSIAPEFASPGFPFPRTAETFELHDVIARVLPAFTHRPLMLVLEDFHWADSSSLALLRFLASQLYGMRLLLVVTFRNFMITYRQELRRTFASVLQQPATDCVTLLPLDRVAIDEIVGRAVEPNTPGPAVKAALYERSGGNPYFALALAAELSTLTTPADVRGLTPRNLAEVVIERLRSLPRSIMVLLSACSVLDIAVPRPFVEELLTQLGLPADLVRAVIKGHLLVVVSGEPELVKFAHPLLRDILRQDLSVDEVAELHRVVVLTLVRGAGTIDEIAAAITTHSAGAMRRIQPALVLAPLMDRADQLSRSFRYREALRHVELALSIIAEQESGFNNTKFQFHVRERHVELSKMMNGGDSDTTGIYDPTNTVHNRTSHSPRAADTTRTAFAGAEDGRPSGLWVDPLDPQGGLVAEPAVRRPLSQ